MHVSAQPFICHACKHEWDGEMLQAVAIKVWLAHARSLRCPACNATYRKIGMLSRAITPQPEPEMEDA